MIGKAMPPTDPPAAAMPVALPRFSRKKCPTAEMAGVKMSDVPSPPRTPHTQGHEDAAGQYQHPRAVRVEEGSDLDAAEESQEDIDAKDPADGAFVIISQLMFLKVGLEDTHGIHHAKSGDSSREASQDDKPCLQPAFGVSYFILKICDGLCLFIVGFSLAF